MTSLATELERLSAAATPVLSAEIIPDLNNIVRAIEDEGDRIYLGSTNDADRLREIANWLDRHLRDFPFPATSPALKATETPLPEVAGLVAEARLDAKAFREHTVYDSEGDPIRLGANADRLDQYADTITAQARQIANLTASINTLNEQSERLSTELSEARRQIAEAQQWAKDQHAAADRYASQLAEREAGLREIAGYADGRKDSGWESYQDGYASGVIDCARIAGRALEGNHD